MSVAERRLEWLTVVFSIRSSRILVLGMWLHDTPRPGCTSPLLPLVTWFVTCKPRGHNVYGVFHCGWIITQFLHSFLKYENITPSYTLELTMWPKLGNKWVTFFFSFYFNFVIQNKTEKCLAFISGLTVITRGSVKQVVESLDWHCDCVLHSDKHSLKKDCVILTKAAILKSFAIVLRTLATCIIKDMPAGGRNCWVVRPCTE